MTEVNHENKILQIFKDIDETTFEFSARESNSVEFKESFNWGSKSSYAKTMSSFANNKGGYLIFGVKNTPRTVVGLLSSNFETLDEASITSYLNGTFSPEINYEKFLIKIAKKNVGIIYTHESESKPTIAIKNDGDIREADIFYRYNARNERIKYPELKRFFEIAKEEERKNWMNMFEKISKIGPENAGVIDIVKGTIDSKGGSLLIDKKLADKLKFIKEGSFSEKGKPTLKLVGDVIPVMVSATPKKEGVNFRLTDDPSAIPVREETILKDYPWDYSDLTKALTETYSDFVLNNRFYRIKKELVDKGLYSHPRYLDPKKPKGTKKDYYNPKILTEFDKHYTRKKVSK